MSEEKSIVDNTDENGEIMARDENGRFTPGHSYATGRPPGSKNKKTLQREAIELIAAERAITPDALEVEIERVGIEKALDGNYQFYKDYMDRTHGPVANINQNLNLNADARKLTEEEQQKLDDLIK